MIPMTLRSLHTSEMLELAREWREQSPLLASYPLTAAFPGLLDEVLEQLAGVPSCQSPGRSEAERRLTAVLLEQLDQEQDLLLRILLRAFDLFAITFPDEAGAFQRASTTILQRGLVSLGASHWSQAGTIERIAARVAQDAGVRATLDSTWLNDTSLKEIYQRLIDVALRLAPLAARLDVSDEQAAEVVQEYLARQRWMHLVSTLRCTAHLAGWSEAHQQAFFGPLDRLSAVRERFPSGTVDPVPLVPEGGTWDEGTRSRASVRVGGWVGVPALPELPLGPRGRLADP
jgi:hypothetical protein